MTEPAQTGESNTAAAPVAIGEEVIREALNKLRQEQNLLLAILAGLLAAAAGAAVWAIVTATTKYQIGWMAVGIGYITGVAVRVGGKGVDKIYGYTGAVLALLGCLAGNLFSICFLIAEAQKAPVLDIVTQLTPVRIGQVMFATFQPMDLLFYGIAIYEGYRFSFRQLTQAQLKALTTS